MIRAFSLLVVCLGLAAPLTAQPVTPVIEFYHTDAIGSVRAVTDAQGQVVRRHDFFPFGEGEGGAAGTAALRFSGKERDAETGLDYFAARYYASRAGRFVTVDPGHVGGNTGDPQSWNAYAYARNNPFRFIDPTGLDYVLALDGYSSVRISDAEFMRLQSNPGAGWRMWGGVIQQFRGDSWVTVGRYYDAFSVLAGDIVRKAQPGVDLAVGIVSVWAGVAAPVPTAIAGCLAAGSQCSAGGTGLAMGLSPKAARILGGLGSLASKTVAEVIRLRGGGGSQVRKVATDLQNLSLGEVAERAARGDESAKTAIKIAKDAKRLHEKH